MLECVPNISEGRDGRVIDALADAVRSCGARLLDVHGDPDHHRSVFTFIGEADVVTRSALALARAAVERIDMNQHQGVHPRIGALDVMPFVPLVGSTMRDAVTAAHAVGQELAREYDLPVFFYGEAALLPARRDLPIVRAGEFEGLAARLTDPAWRPDAGPTTPHPTAGAAIVGARRILIAFNAWLGTSDVDAARSIARAIRESSGGLPAVRAIGVALPSRNVVQVAMNLLDYRRTSVPIVIERVEREAVRFGVRVVDYELVGCAPADAFAPPLSRAVRLRPSQLLEAELLTESRPEP